MVVVQILAGTALGPGALGAACPDLCRFVFHPAVVQPRNGVACWVVVLFGFIAGISLDPRQAWRRRRESGITAGLALGCRCAPAPLPGWRPWPVRTAGSARVGRQLALLVVVMLASLAFRQLLQHVPVRDRWHLGLAWLALCALGADRSGLHGMVGACLAGVVIDAHWRNQRLPDRLRHHVLAVGDAGGLPGHWSGRPVRRR